MIHVTFSSSGAGSLRQALGIRDQRKKVVDITDDLSWGPISHTDFFAERFGSITTCLLIDSGGWDWIGTGAQEFQRKLENSKEHLVWVAPQNAKELCGLHWYLDRFGGENSAFIVVDHGIPGTWAGQPPHGIGELGIEQFQFLLGNAERAVWDKHRFPKERWAQLCDDATNLRIVNGGMATSVPNDYFDHIILAQCTGKWRKLGRVVVDVMIFLWQENHYIGDDCISWRLRELASLGKIVASQEIRQHAYNPKDPILIRLV